MLPEGLDITYIAKPLFHQGESHGLGAFLFSEKKKTFIGISVRTQFLIIHKEMQ